MSVEAAGELLEQRRDLVLQRQAVIAANPALRDREVIKFARLASDITDVLRRRGIDEPLRGLAAEAGVSVLKRAFERWLEEDNGRDFAALVRDSLKELRAVTSGVPAQPSNERQVDQTTGRSSSHASSRT